MLKPRLEAIVAIVVLAGLSRLLADQTFVPDAVFTGSSLTGWRAVGQSEWRADRGELIGRPLADAGGWLFLDESYQDVGFRASFRCANGCRTGVLLRAERTPAGMKGVYVSLAEGDVATYRVTLDSEGRIVQRERLRSGGGMLRIAPPPPPPPPPGAPSGGGGGLFGPIPMPPGVPEVLTAPATGLRAGDWNEVEIFLDANIARTYLNDAGSATVGVVENDAGRYGPLALYVGGSGEVRFRDVGYKDLGLKVSPKEESSADFRMQRISDFYYSWGVAAGDFNRDGVTDITTGPHVYFGPDYTTSREVFLTETVSPSTEYPYPPSRRDPALLPDSAWVVLAGDFTGDGWPDILTTDNLVRPGAVMYVNPAGEKRRWDRVTAVPVVQSEITLLRDIDNDGRPELVYTAEGYVRYAEPNPADPTGPWIVRTVSERGPWGRGHGLGVGDINGDGRLDILNPWGWWEQPPTGSADSLWTYHPQAFARWGRTAPGGATMAVYDVNGDGLNDVVTSLQGHGFGLAWFEQQRDARGAISFVRHMIMDDYSATNAGGVTFSQLHGLASGDVDADGVPDVIVGKRYWSHLDSYFDPDPYGPAVVYWYRTVRNPGAPGGAEFVPHLIHNRSGVGSDVLATDLDGDGGLDIVNSTNRGTFIFWGRARR